MQKGAQYDKNVGLLARKRQFPAIPN